MTVSQDEHKPSLASPAAKNIPERTSAIYDLRPDCALGYIILHSAVPPQTARALAMKMELGLTVNGVYLGYKTFIGTPELKALTRAITEVRRYLGLTALYISASSVLI